MKTKQEGVRENAIGQKESNSVDIILNEKEKTRGRELGNGKKSRRN